MSSRRYLIISPCRNEAAFMRQTLDTVVAQCERPAKWVIVDDGSTDETPEILAEYAEKHDFIQIVTRKDRGRRSVGPGVIDAFYAGLEVVELEGFEYLCKLDLDLELPESYFALLMNRMEANPRLGTCSGKAYYRDAKSGKLVSENIGDDVSVGASKFFRVACFQQIGGFAREVMWDGIDCHRSRMLGWQVASWDVPELRFIHLRPMGSSHKGILRGRMRHGFGQYYMGTSLVFITVSALYRVSKRPIFVGSLAMWSGYVYAFLVRKKRYEDAEFRRYLRRYQRCCLIGGKKLAQKRFESELNIRWHPTRNADRVAPTL